MKLNLFLPFLRRPRRNAPSPQPGPIVRLSLKVLPGVVTDPRTARPGLIRRLLKRTGPTWLSSPVRRAIQAGCLVLFLWLFFYVAWPYGSTHYASELARKEVIEAEAFLALDPLVSISTAIAARTWVWSLYWAGAILAIGLLFPRGFCGYLCPLGTLIDLFDWAMGKRVRLFHLPADRADGWWVHTKYFILLGVLLCAVFGVLVSGFVAAIPVVTRGLLFALAPLEIGVRKGWYQVPPMNAGHFVSLALFAVVLGLGLIRPRFWCRYVCPTGAVFSTANAVRLAERKVEASCINCNKCVEICPFDAIKADFTTRTDDCTLCQTCGGVCPTQAIKFVGRWDRADLKVENDPPTRETPLSRRGFLAGAAASVAVAVGATRLLGSPSAEPPVRPPGSVPEEAFLDLCIRCGECFKACPNNVLHPVGFDYGGRGIWTPKMVADWSGCEPSCNNCGQVCPTGAIRAVSLTEKRWTRMGLAIVDERTCLPWAGVEACQMCVDECDAAGYHAIEFQRVGVETDEDGMPVEGSGFQAPVVLADKCIGCGLCQTRCFKINVKQKGLLDESAIIVRAGEGREDRLLGGSVLDVRAREADAAVEELRRSRQSGGDEFFIPEF